MPFLRLFLVFITGGRALLGGGNVIFTGGKALLGGGITFPGGGKALLSGGNDIFSGGRALLSGGNELMKQLSMPESAWQNSKMSTMKDICQKLDAQVVIAIQWNVWSRIKSPTEGR